MRGLENQLRPLMTDRLMNFSKSEKSEKSLILIFTEKIFILNTQAGLPHQQPHMQLGAKRKRAPGRSLQGQRAANNPLHRRQRGLLLFIVW